MTNKAKWFSSLSEEEQKAGYIKFNIPDENINSLNGEGVWGWLTPEDKAKYMDDNFHGVLKAILCNTPLTYFGILRYGTEVEIRCNGKHRPILNPDWVKENILKEASK